ncbi:hypothetical protein GPECTOR_55g332 [Gonium pectorale]|uniref:cyclin-dependent kinase n=1 Tax=Gonium pectorale TaxID=33097 RepID=A0A150G6B1_GONPE|nr:hypothetical protein GPECTOR_55g332 [Gonium pectorale]|eukprot:KXZ45426.1 hypothetical protein GPECTOR_55g332 [Gonium pectorale]
MNCTGESEALLAVRRYTYVSTISSGAYGVVYLCRDAEEGRYVAAKGIKQAHVDSTVMRLTVREVKILRMLPPHVNIVRLLEAFRSKSGRVYLVFEHVERSLYQVVHRDVKPANVLLTGYTPGVGSGGVAKLCDFGFARLVRTGPGAELSGAQQAASRRNAGRGPGSRDAASAAAPAAAPLNLLDEGAALSSYVMTRWYRPPA